MKRVFVFAVLLILLATGIALYRTLIDPPDPLLPGDEPAAPAQEPIPGALLPEEGAVADGTSQDAAVGTGEMAGSGSGAEGEAEDEDWSLTKESEYFVRVTVLDHDRRPVEAKVEIQYVHGAGWPMGELETDDGGRVLAYLPEPGTYIAVAVRDGTRLEHTFVVSEEKPTEEFTLEYQGSASVSGIVHASSGGLEEDLRGEHRVLGEQGLVVELVHREGIATLASLVGADGRYRISGLPGGDYTLLIRSKFHAERLGIAAGEDLAHDILLPAGRIFGRTFEDWTNEPAKNLQVVIQLISSAGDALGLFQEAGHARVSDRLSPDEHGRYAFSNLPDGEYSLFANGKDLGVVRRQATLSAGARSQEVNFPMPQGAAIELTVTDEEGNDLDSFVCMAGGITWGFGGTVLGFSVGVQDFIAYSDGYEIQIQRGVNLTPGDPVPVRFALAKAVPGKLVFKDPSGAPVAGVRVSLPDGEYDRAALTRGFWRSDENPWVESNADGEVTVWSLPPGTWRLIAKKSGFAVVDREFDLSFEQAVVEIGLLPAATEFVRRVRIVSITEGGQAGRLGVRVGDVIRSYDGTEIKTIKNLSEAIAAAKAAGKETVNLVLDSGGEEVSLEVGTGVLGVRLAEEEE